MVCKLYTVISNELASRISNLVTYLQLHSIGLYPTDAVRWPLCIIHDREQVKEVAQPVEEKKLYFCNEAWSLYQGWVEGALMSTQNAVGKLLNLIPGEGWTIHSQGLLLDPINFDIIITTEVVRFFFLSNYILIRQIKHKSTYH